MSRWRDDEREEASGRAGESSNAATDTSRPSARERLDPDVSGRDRDAPVAEPYVERLDRPCGEAREAVALGSGTVRLNGDETRVLATIGAFRAVPVADLGPDAQPDSGALRQLRREELVDVVTVSRGANASQRDASIAVLTERGRDLLEAHRTPDSHPEQAYHAGLVKPAELAHDTALHRVYREAAAELADEGRRVTRVVLDYELKADYQRFLNRPDRPADATLESERAAFAEAHGLTVVDGHLELPDLRLEYEEPDGTRGVRDVELVTEHYSRTQLAGKRQAGFTMYRLGGRAGHAIRGGTPYDPHRITQVLR